MAEQETPKGQPTKGWDRHEQFFKDLERRTKELPTEEPLDVFQLDLDDFFTEGYVGGCYPENDIFGDGHYGTCFVENREEYKARFLEEMAKRFDEVGKVIKAERVKSPQGDYFTRADDEE